MKPYPKRKTNTEKLIAKIADPDGGTKYGKVRRVSTRQTTSTYWSWLAANIPADELDDNRSNSDVRRYIIDEWVTKPSRKPELELYLMPYRITQHPITKQPI